MIKYLRSSKFFKILSKRLKVHCLCMFTTIKPDIIYFRANLRAYDVLGVNFYSKAPAKQVDKMMKVAFA